MAFAVDHAHYRPRTIGTGALGLGHPGTRGNAVPGYVLLFQRGETAVVLVSVG